MQKGQAENNLFYQRGMMEADIMKAKGAYYSQERAYDVLQAAAENEGGSGIGNGMINAGIGLGVGVGLGQGIGSAMNDVAKNSLNNVQQPASNTIICSKCSTANDSSSKFCKACGNQLIQVNHCISCSAEIAADAAFCPKCGAPQKVEKTCPNCAEKNDKDSAFCKKCGTKL